MHSSTCDTLDNLILSSLWATQLTQSALQHTPTFPIKVLNKRCVVSLPQREKDLRARNFFVHLAARTLVCGCWLWDVVMWVTFHFVVSGGFEMCWLTDGEGRQPDASVVALFKRHPSSLSFVSGYLRGEAWMAWRAQREERAVTLKNPLHIRQCQEFSAKVDSEPLSNTNKQQNHFVTRLWTELGNNMKEHFCHSVEDISYGASFSFSSPCQSQC